MNNTEALTRIALINHLVGQLRTEMKGSNPDPRNPAVIEKLLEQRATLVDVLEKNKTEQAKPVVAKPSSDGKPPAQVVGLKALKLNIRRTGLD